MKLSSFFWGDIRSVVMWMLHHSLFFYRLVDFWFILCPCFDKLIQNFILDDSKSTFYWESCYVLVDSRLPEASSSGLSRKLTWIFQDVRSQLLGTLQQCSPVKASTWLFLLYFLKWLSLSSLSRCQWPYKYVGKLFRIFIIELSNTLMAFVILNIAETTKNLNV